MSEEIQEPREVKPGATTSENSAAVKLPTALTALVTLVVFAADIAGHPLSTAAVEQVTTLLQTFVAPLLGIYVAQRGYVKGKVS